MNIGQGGDSLLGPGEKSAARVSRMLGSGLADAVVLVLELDGFCDPTAIENVVVTERVADVLEGAGDSVASESSEVARACTVLL